MAGLELHQVIFYLILFGSCGYALILGGKPERLGAAVNLIASFASVALLPSITARWHHPEISIWVIDCSVALSFLALAIFTDRFWPIWAFGFALSDLASHLARVLGPSSPAIAYYSAAVIWAYPALAALVFGTWKTQQRRSRQRIMSF